MGEMQAARPCFEIQGGHHMRKAWKQLRTARRCLCLVFAVMFVVSAAMTGTLALQGGSNIVNNYFGGTTPTEPPPTDPPPTNPPPPPTISVSVVKEWAGDTGNVRPESVQVQLYRNGAVQGQPMPLNVGNSWKYTWTGLSQSGTYTVEEVDVPQNYTAAVTRNGNAFTITNTYTPPAPATNEITVSKVWVGVAPHPDSATIVLYKDGNEHATIVLTAANDWTHTWTGIDKTAAWTLGETNVPAGYEASFMTISPGVCVVTNTKTATPAPNDDITGTDTVIVSGQKYWRHGSNAQRSYPTSATIYIHADGAVVKEITITGPSWKYSIALPKFDDSGKEIKYTVSEKKIAGYTSVVSGWNITNVHDSSGTGGPKTGDNSTMWLWFVLMIASAIGMKLALGNVSLRRRKGA